MDINYIHNKYTKKFLIIFESRVVLCNNQMEIIKRSLFQAIYHLLFIHWNNISVLH